jgi:hypothetical protein
LIDIINPVKVHDMVGVGVEVIQVETIEQVYGLLVKRDE